MEAPLLDERSTDNCGSIHYGDNLIHFLIEPRHTHTEKVRIKVYADNRVIVQAPPMTTHDEIISAVKKRARWVYRQLNSFAQYRAELLPRHYVSGESHFYLGRRHMLKVTAISKSKAKVKLLRGILKVSTTAADTEKTRALLMDWYKQRAEAVFNRRLDKLLSKTPWILEKPSIALRLMHTQWGSCSPEGKLTLNPHLVKAPTICVDYVLLHELCHIAEHNHSEKFYQLMKQVMPDWQQVKTRLDNMAYFYLNDV